MQGDWEGGWWGLGTPGEALPDQMALEDSKEDESPFISILTLGCDHVIYITDKETEAQAGE